MAVSRRDMLKQSAFATAAAAAMGAGLSSQAQDARPQGRPGRRRRRVRLQEGSTVLFQGDSITDAGRKFDLQDKPNNFQALSNGYAGMIAMHLMTKHKDLGLKVYNRGISGHKVPDLANRWDRDCLDLKPDVLSILIGVNDIWHKLNGNYNGTVKDYHEGYVQLLDRTKTALPDVQLVLCEPFVLRCGAVNDKWFPEFDERIAAAKQVAEQFDAIWVPFQDMFTDAVAAGSPSDHWAGDGVHPSAHGAALMAQRWVSETGL